jgi:hypothetical protein
MERTENDDFRTSRNLVGQVSYVDGSHVHADGTYDGRKVLPDPDRETTFSSQAR